MRVHQGRTRQVSEPPHGDRRPAFGRAVAFGLPAVECRSGARDWDGFGTRLVGRIADGDLRPYRQHGAAACRGQSREDRCLDAKAKPRDIIVNH